MSLTASPQPSQIPVTVLTGYLGAGKTTLLNRILSENHGKKYAVIINEFGELGVDNDLVVGADEEVFEMNNGCICCTVRGDLIRIIEGLMKRKGKLDGIIVETTGLADPAPVAQTFFVDDDVKSNSRLDAIVTVVDAKHLLQRLVDSHEAEEQVAFADVIVLNKTDLVAAEELARVEAAHPHDQQNGPHFARREGRCADRPVDGPRRLRPRPHARIGAGFPVGRGRSPARRRGRLGQFDLGPTARHGAVQPVDRRRPEGEGTGPAAHQGHSALPRQRTNALRFRLSTCSRTASFIGPWKEGASRQSRIVFIGRNVDRFELQRGFEACVAR